MKCNCLVSLILLFSSSSIYAEYTLKNGKLIESNLIASASVQDHYSSMINAYQKKQWKSLIQESITIVKNFAYSPYAQEAVFFLGVGYFHDGDYEMANFQFGDYLTNQSTPKYFEEAIQYKFEIAEKFRGGSRKHLMGFENLPKWMPADSDALVIYDEVISALPHHDLAAQSLYGKAQILMKNEDFRAAIETYQNLIRRFPKHPLAVESFIGIGRVYFQQSKSEYPDPDYLDLAELNLRKFRTGFPGEEKLAVAEMDFSKMQEHYAIILFDTARFYERTNKWGAARIYYNKILNSYPNTSIATKCSSRLIFVEEKLEKDQLKKDKQKSK